MSSSSSHKHRSSSKTDKGDKERKEKKKSRRHGSHSSHSHASGSSTRSSTLKKSTDSSSSHTQNDRAASSSSSKSFAAPPPAAGAAAAPPPAASPPPPAAAAAATKSAPAPKKKRSIFRLFRFGKYKRGGDDIAGDERPETDEEELAAARAQRAASRDRASSSSAPAERNTPKTLDELPDEVRKQLKLAGLAESAIREKWWLVLAIVQFVGKVRFDNDWKDAQKAKAGSTGRDFRGSTSGLVRSNEDPRKQYKVSNNVLGTGGFGSVYGGVRRSDGVNVAIKKVPNVTSKQKRENLWEIGLLKAAQHECVVAYYESYAWDNTVWMVMERLEGGSLADAVALSGGFREAHVAFAAERVLTALAFMHKRSLVHRDLKSANLMFTTDGRVKIIDFGLCRDVSRMGGCSMLGSPFWMPPEMVLYEVHERPGDIWSLAISLLEMINGHPPNHQSAVKALFLTATEGIDLSQWKFSAPLTSFLEASLRREPSERATADELLKHAFLAKSCGLDDMKRLMRTIFLQGSLSLIMPF